MRIRRWQKRFKKRWEFIKQLTLGQLLTIWWKRVCAMNWQNWAHLCWGLVLLVCIGFGYRYPKIFSESEETAVNILTGETVRVRYEVMESRFYEYPETKEVKTSQKKGPSFLYSKATEGAIGFFYATYELRYDTFGRLLSRRLIGDTYLQEAQDIEYRRGSKVKVGAYFYPKYSRYGVDCVGCSGEFTGIGNFASGIHYENGKGVRQYDGTYDNTITYEGYYILAADPSIPFCTVVEIENHRFEGAGIRNNEPFQAVVLDRGGAIKGNRIDLFIGMQSDMQIGYGKWKTDKKTKVTIIKRGKWVRNRLGQYACKLD